MKKVAIDCKATFNQIVNVLQKRKLLNNTVEPQLSESLGTRGGPKSVSLKLCISNIIFFFLNISIFKYPNRTVTALIEQSFP